MTNVRRTSVEVTLPVAVNAVWSGHRTPDPVGDLRRQLQTALQTRFGEAAAAVSMSLEPVARKRYRLVVAEGDQAAAHSAAPSLPMVLAWASGQLTDLVDARVAGGARAVPGFNGRVEVHGETVAFDLVGSETAEVAKPASPRTASRDDSRPARKPTAWNPPKARIF